MQRGERLPKLNVRSGVIRVDAQRQLRARPRFVESARQQVDRSSAYLRGHIVGLQLGNPEHLADGSGRIVRARGYVRKPCVRLDRLRHPLDRIPVLDGRFLVLLRFSVAVAALDVAAAGDRWIPRARTGRECRERERCEKSPRHYRYSGK